MIKDAIKKRIDSVCVNYNEKLIESNKLTDVVDLDCVRNEIIRYEKKIDDDNLEILQKAKQFAKSEKIYNEIFKDLDEENFKEKRIKINKKIKVLRSWASKWKSDLEKDTKNYNDLLIDEALSDHHKNFDMSKLYERKISNKYNTDTKLSFHKYILPS
jgi:hypothetical protein